MAATTAIALYYCVAQRIEVTYSRTILQVAHPLLARLQNDMATKSLGPASRFNGAVVTRCDCRFHLVH